MRSHDGNSSDDLDDTELLARERDDRADFRRWEEAEPHYRDTTYGVIHGSPGLIASWERWWKTNLAARMRGILTRTLGR